ncbi:MAG: HAMP domain-containing protein, partial [Planctomycetes bacterium]|nr:HAMP domain-containing protein [Planctomycetota bacterium]
MRVFGSIRGKLLGTSAITVLLLGGVTATSLHGIDSLQTQLMRYKTSSEALRNHLDSDMMHDALRADVLAAMQAGTAQDIAAVEADLKEHCDRFGENVAKNKELKLGSAIAAALDAVNRPLNDYIVSAKELVALAAKDKAAATAEFPTFQDKFKALESRMEELSDLIQKNTDDATASAVNASSLVVRMVIGTAAAAGIATLAFALMLVRNINSRVTRLLDRARTIAAADLTGAPLAVTSTDELGQLTTAINAMQSSLTSLVTEVQSGTSQIDAG